jgi:hypothetical protein
LRASVWLFVVTLAALVARGLGPSRQAIRKEAAERVASFDRYVDASVRLDVVRADPHGNELLPGRRMSVIRSHFFGGTIDTTLPTPAVIGWFGTEPKRVWICSEDQERAILHADDEPQGLFVMGGEGAGKSTLTPMWLYLRWMELLGSGSVIGALAPTFKRTKFVRDELFKHWDPSWYDYKQTENLLLLAGDCSIQFATAKKSSSTEGSPIQGSNYAASTLDELQDVKPELVNDLASRGRAGPGGGETYKQLGTCTAKTSPVFRGIRDRLVTSGMWGKLIMPTWGSPFVSHAFLERMRKTMDPGEFRRRFGAEDPPNDELLYKGFSRARNLRPIPLGAKKITSYVLTQKMGPHPSKLLRAMLAGNDPGQNKAATIFLDAYEFRGIPDPVWWVRGEVFTRKKTTLEHGMEVLAMARRFACNVPKRAEILHVRSQPYGQSDKKPDLDVYRILSSPPLELDVKAAQYKPATGTGTGRIAKESRFEMINTLLNPPIGAVRLYIECDDQQRPVAPELVTSLETMERDEYGDGEHEDKDAQDKSDPSAALGYGLWPFEKAAATKLREEMRRGLLGAGAIELAVL